MMIRTPEMNFMRRTDVITELIDLFPTLVDLAGLPSLPSCPAVMDTNKIDLCAEGMSLKSLFVDGETEDEGLSDKAAVVQVRRGGNIMGFSLVTQKYRWDINSVK